MKKNIKVVIGSVRTGRAGKRVAEWFMNQTANFDGNLDFELIDLAEINLPFMNEPVPPSMGNGEYSHEQTRSWSRLIGSADGFVFVTPEYNHGYPPALKNAVDYLYKEWKGKPVGFVGYGGGGAMHSIRQLREILNFLGMKLLDTQIGIANIWEAFDEQGRIKERYINGDVKGFLAELENAFSE